MNPAEEAELITLLNDGRDAFLAAISKVSAEVSDRSPGPGRWTALQCVEHVAIAEEHMLSQNTSAALAAEPVVNAARELLIRSRGARRERRVEAPEAAHPRGRFRSIEEAVKHFLRRTKTIEFVNRSEDLRAMSTSHPVLGPLNCYEMVLLMAVHPQRHAKQIDEIVSIVGNASEEITSNNS
jgi:hypothetical protein